MSDSENMPATRPDWILSQQDQSNGAVVPNVEKKPRKPRRTKAEMAASRAAEYTKAMGRDGAIDLPSASCAVDVDLDEITQREVVVQKLVAKPYGSDDFWSDTLNRHMAVVFAAACFTSMTVGGLIGYFLR